MLKRKPLNYVLSALENLNSKSLRIFTPPYVVFCGSGNQTPVFSYQGLCIENVSLESAVHTVYHATHQQYLVQWNWFRYQMLYGLTGRRRFTQPNVGWYVTGL